MAAGVVSVSEDDRVTYEDRAHEVLAALLEVVLREAGFRVILSGRSRLPRPRALLAARPRTSLSPIQREFASP
jgi:hypothetical protein